MYVLNGLHAVVSNIQHYHIWKLNVIVPLNLDKGEYTRSRFLKIYLSVLHEHLRGNICYYGNGRTQNVIMLLVIVGIEDHVQVNIRCVMINSMINSNFHSIIKTLQWDVVHIWFMLVSKIPSIINNITLLQNIFKRKNAFQ